MTVRPVLFDTSIYVAHLRNDDHGELIERSERAERVRVSAVVLGELYAGTRSPADKRDLDRYARSRAALGFLVTPGAEDWARAGQVMRADRALHGTVAGPLAWNDVLILLAGVRAGADVVTEDGRHFVRWSRLLGRMGLVAHVRVV